MLRKCTRTLKRPALVHFGVERSEEVGLRRVCQARWDVRFAPAAPDTDYSLHKMYLYSQYTI